MKVGDVFWTIWHGKRQKFRVISIKGEEINVEKVNE